MYDDTNDFDFDLSFLNIQVSSPSIIGVNPNEAFKDIFGNENNQRVLKLIKLGKGCKCSNICQFEQTLHGRVRKTVLTSR